MKERFRDYLESLFNSQIQTLKDRGCPDQIVEMFQNQRSEVISKASTMAFNESHIPFLLVIPRIFRSPYDLMTMVHNRSKAGYSYLNPTAIFDTIEIPRPYYILNIEDGVTTRGESPEDATETLKKRSRSSLTICEVIALCTHTDVLSRHFVWAAGSRYRTAEKVPYIYLNKDDQPELFWSHVGKSYENWGVASCGSREAFESWYI